MSVSECSLLLPFILPATPTNGLLVEERSSCRKMSFPILNSVGLVTLHILAMVMKKGFCPNPPVEGRCSDGEIGLAFERDQREV